MGSQSSENRVESNRRYYEKNKAAQAARNAANRLRNNQHVRQLKSGPCVDCSRCYPYYVMQFDHVRGEKLSDVSRLASSIVSIARIDAEVAKCDLVCANCHAERTWQRNQDRVP